MKLCDSQRFEIVIGTQTLTSKWSPWSVVQFKGGKHLYLLVEEVSIHHFHWHQYVLKAAIRFFFHRVHSPWNWCVPSVTTFFHIVLVIVLLEPNRLHQFLLKRICPHCQFGAPVKIITPSPLICDKILLILSFLNFLFYFYYAWWRPRATHLCCHVTVSDVVAWHCHCARASLRWLSK